MFTWLIPSNVDWEEGKYTSAVASVAPLLVNIELKLQSEGSKYTSAIALVYWAWTRGTWAESAN